MTQDPLAEIRSLAVGVRSVATVFTLILSYFNVRLAVTISNFSTIFADMLAGKPLPTLTSFVIRNQSFLVILSLIIPLAALAFAIWIRSHKRALFLISALMIIIAMQIYFTWLALFMPLMSIISGLQGPP